MEVGKNEMIIVTEYNQFDMKQRLIAALKTYTTIKLFCTYSNFRQKTE
jgi:hypothetical protein